jgi:phage tail sheath protein FI
MGTKGKRGKGKGGANGHYLRPRAHIEEVSSGGRPIETVGTSIAAFVRVSQFSPVRLAGTVALAAALAIVVLEAR